MKIVSVDETIVEVPCVVPLARGGRTDSHFPICRGYVDKLPGRLEALIVASDLQARERGTHNRPIGVIVAAEVAKLAKRLKLAPAGIGVILAGDLYTSATLDRRFGVGDVDEVWNAFADSFCWVTGVLGNVDRLGKAARKRHTLLEGKSVTFDSLRIAGVCGIIGASKMENRRPEAAFIKDVKKVLGHNPDVLVLHEGPNIPGLKLPGTDAVRVAIRDYEGLVICGHNQWPRAVAPLHNATVLNTDGRCILFTPVSQRAAT